MAKGGGTRNQSMTFEENSAMLAKLRAMKDAERKPAKKEWSGGNDTENLSFDVKEGTIVITGNLLAPMPTQSLTKKITVKATGQEKEVPRDSLTQCRTKARGYGNTGEPFSFKYVDAKGTEHTVNGKFDCKVWIYPE